MAELIIYRNGNPFTTVKIGEELVYNGQFMGENKIVGSFDTPVTKEFFIGDYVLHNSQKFILNDLPELLREAKNQFTYGAVFEAEEYSLYNKLLRHLKVSDFSYFGKPQQFVELILENYNVISSGWTAGDIDDVDEGQNIQFQEDSCRTALQKVVDTFEMEFKIDPVLKKIHVKKSIGQLLPDVTFRYGMGNGLYSLTRQPAADTNVYTRFYGFGSSKNLPATYRAGTKRLIFEQEKVDRNIEIYGVRETAIVFEDIFPQRSAPITSINGENEITDSAIDFNLNSVVVEGQAKVVFKTGDLGGNEFLISSYNHATKTIKFKPNKDENGYVLPNDTVKASVGDIYTLLGIEMPQSYIDAAELQVKERTEEFADIYKDPQFAFALSIDEKFIRTNNLLGMINPGDRVAVEDSEMDVDTTLRVQAISYPISNPGKIQATINDKITYSLADKIKKYIAKQAQDIIVVNRNLAETGRDLSIRQQEFQNAVYDPDGYFDGTKIKPNTIEAISIKTGVRSQQFTLGVIFRFNYLADANAVQWTSGQLVHNTIDPTTIKTWNIAGNSASGLNPTSLYYIFARCNKSTNDGIIVFDTVQHLVDTDPNHYYFLIGMVSSSISGVRWPSLTYGTTELNGRFITTGKIQSQDGNTSFDLDSGIIKGRITFGENGVSTVVDGNLVTTSSIILGNGIVNNAGITGLGTLTNDIRFWAGADFSSKSSAPFRVDQSGHLFASNATISGHIEATSGTIAGVSINATDLFNLDGSKVKIFPDKGIRVLDGGYFSLPKIAPATADMPVSEWCMYITEAATPSGTPPIVISRFIDLLDVDATGRLQDFVVYWDAATAKHRYKASSFAPAGDVYTKSEINNFFGGITAITGYNKTNWDTAFSLSHLHSNKAILDSINQSLSTSDDVQFNSVYGYYVIGDYIIASDIYSSGEIRAALGLRTANGTIFEDLSGYAVSLITSPLTAGISVTLPTASGKLALVSQIPTNVVHNDGGTYNVNISGTSANTSGIGGIGIDIVTYGTNLTQGFGYDGDTNKFKPYTSASWRGWLGLPSAGAYDLKWVTDNGAFTSNGREISMPTNDGSKYLLLGGNTAYARIGAYGAGAFQNLTLDAANVGIGTTAPGYKLEVIGSSSIYGNLFAGNYTDDSNGTWTAAHFRINGINPAVGFHYPGYYGAALYMNSGGTLIWAGNGITTGGGGISTSGAVDCSRIIAGYDSGQPGSVNASNWFRSAGNSGWYSASYDGGIYMSDYNWLRIYNGKGLLVSGPIGIQAEKIQASNMLVFPKIDPVVADMPVDQWVAYIKEVI